MLFFQTWLDFRLAAECEHPFQVLWVELPIDCSRSQAQVHLTWLCRLTSLPQLGVWVFLIPTVRRDQQEYPEIHLNISLQLLTLSLLFQWFGMNRLQSMLGVPQAFPLCLRLGFLYFDFSCFYTLFLGSLCGSCHKIFTWRRLICPIRKHLFADGLLLTVE